MAYVEKLLVQPAGHQVISPSVDSSNVPLLKWTGSKTALVELVYGLHPVGILNNGEADVKTIIIGLQHAFNIDVGNYYDLFQDIRMRKTGQTKFLDNMKVMLMKRIEEME